MMRELGKEPSARSVAAHYVRLIDGFVLDQEDAPLAEGVRSLGMDVLAAPTVMRTIEDRITLARTVLEFARSVRQRKALEVE